MARLLFGGGFFLFESIVSGYTLTQRSADALPMILALTALGAAPLACQLARSICPGEIDSETESEPV